MFLIFQVKAPDVELGNNLLIDQLLTLRGDGRPTALGDRTINRSRQPPGSRYPPQAIRASTSGGEDDLAAVHGPGRMTDDRAMVEREALNSAPRCGNDIDIIAHSGDGGADERKLRAVRRERGLGIERSSGRFGQPLRAVVG